MIRRLSIAAASAALVVACATPYDPKEQENLDSLSRADARLNELLPPTKADSGDGESPRPSPEAIERLEIADEDELERSPEEIQKAIENYRKIVELSPQNRRVRFEAQRRLADLQVEVGELNPEAESQGLVSTEESIDLYNSLLDSRPSDPDNDRILYQLARAYQNTGQVSLAIESLRELTLTFPDTPLWTDAEFRRAELLFNQRDYAKAEQAYAAVMKQGQDTPYFERAQYKYGWSIFKQERYADSLDSFITILDRELPVGAVDNLEATLEVVPRAQRELVRDVLRVVSLSFSYLGGGPAVTDYFSDQPTRSYEPVLYDNLGKLFREKGRYNDAAEAYAALAERSPTHPLAPKFQARIIDIFDEAGFDELVLQAKIDYVEKYDLDQVYWTAHTPEDSPEAFELLRSNMEELARHWHSRAQKATAGERSELFQRATATYARYLDRFPEAGNRPEINFLLAEAHFQSGNFAAAAEQFERTAWEYPPHERSAEAGYAAVLARQERLEDAQGRPLPERIDEAVATSLRFADSFPEHPEQPKVLLRAAEELYRIDRQDRAIEIATRVTQLENATAWPLRAPAWSLIGYAHMDQQRYAAAEEGLSQALNFTEANTETAAELRDNLAVAVYKQGEQALAADETETAIGHFLRVKEVAPDSELAATGDFDAAAALISLESWERAASVLKGFRQRYPRHELQREVTRKLAGVYLNNDQPLLAAGEFNRIAGSEGEAPDVRREAAWQAATLYDDAGSAPQAMQAYASYAQRYPQPYAQRLKAYERLIEMTEERGDTAANRRWLQALIEADRQAGGQATPRSRTLAAAASLTLANDARQRFESLPLRAPLNRTLPAKQQAMQAALEAYRQTADYAIAEYTTEATYRIGALYATLAKELMSSEPPRGLSDLEREEYQFLLEDQAFPLEDKAIEVHQTNTRRTLEGIYDDWVRASYRQLAQLLPAQFDKPERSEVVFESLD